MYGASKPSHSSNFPQPDLAGDRGSHITVRQRPLSTKGPDSLPPQGLELELKQGLEKNYQILLKMFGARAKP